MQASFPIVDECRHELEQIFALIKAADLQRSRGIWGCLAATRTRRDFASLRCVCMYVCVGGCQAGLTMEKCSDICSLVDQQLEAFRRGNRGEDSSLAERQQRLLAVLRDIKAAIQSSSTQDSIQGLEAQLAACARSLGMRVTTRLSNNLKLCSINTARINSSNEYLAAHLVEASQTMQTVVTNLFGLPFLDPRLKLAEIEAQLNIAQQSCAVFGWLQNVQSLPKFFEYARDYLQASAKPVLSDSDLRMRDLIEAFAADLVSFEQIMGDKAEQYNDRRILSVPDRIKNRHSILFNESIRSSQPEFVERWFASVNKEDREIVENISKYLVPRGGTLQELGKSSGSVELKSTVAEDLKVAYTMCFYLLFVADLSYSSFPGEYPPVPSQSDVNAQKLQALSSILNVFDVVFIQEPLASLDQDLVAEQTLGARVFIDGRQSFAAIVTSPFLGRYPQTQISHEFIYSFSCLDGVLPVILQMSEDEHVAFVSVHAKPTTDTDQIAVVQDLRALAENIRRFDHAVKTIFVGIDANTNLAKCLPGAPDGPPTSVKMRSFLQMQLAKAHLKHAARKDFILKIEEDITILQADVSYLAEDAGVPRLEQVTRQLKSQKNTPSRSHPFDHYVVSVDSEIALA